MARFDKAVGRYVYLTVEGVDYRVYFEESGSGIPLLLQHTAGVDARQWRFFLEDEDSAIAGGLPLSLRLLRLAWLALRRLTLVRLTLVRWSISPS